MLINELFNSKAEYEVVRRETSEFGTEAMINGRKIEFDAVDNGEGVWEVAFAETKPGERSTFNVTGSGAAIEVFNMVKASMTQFMQEYKPKVIQCSASKSEKGSSTRASLYKRVFKSFSNYTLETEEKANKSYFELTRK